MALGSGKKTALVTAASSDIGLALVEELLLAEYDVCGQFNSNGQALKKLKENANFTALQLDLSHSEQAQELINQTIKSRGRLDVLINAIGPLYHKPLTLLMPQEWHDQIHFNLNLTFYMAHFAQKFLIESSGQIINFAYAGADALTARIDTTAYCSAKAGVIILTKSLAASLAPHGVRVNAISPGLVEAGPIQSETRKAMANNIPWGRPATPQEVAAVVRLLLIKSPQYVTGSVIPVAGAWEYL